MLSPKEVVNKWVDAFNDGDVDMTAFRGLPFRDRKCSGFWTTPRRGLSIPSL